MTSMQHILISNDDGCDAPGIHVLAKAVQQIARVTVVAPDKNCSGASNSLSLRRPLRVAHEENGFYRVHGTPADCVHLAITGMFDELPDMVISGINAGANMGDDIMYSGTVAAAIEGRFLGLPAIAVSLAGHELNHYDTAARVVLDVLQRLSQKPLPKDSILNINVPDCPYEALSEWQATRAGARHQSQPIIQQDLPGEDRYFQIGPVGPEADAGPGTDFFAVANGSVSITPIQIDMTRHNALPALHQWLNQ